MSMNPVEAVLAFMDLINRRDVDALVGLMTSDHVLIDSLGRQVRGRETLRAGWRSYYQMCPDYRVSHDQILRDGNTVVVFGSAAGTISVAGKLAADNQWEIPAAWRAVVKDGLIQEWRIYADNKPVYDILAKSPK
jgi:ketosteroid isomerase-like protein